MISELLRIRITLLTVVIVFLFNLSAHSQQNSIRMICHGDSVKLIATSKWADYYNWYRHGELIRYKTDSVITVIDTGMYEVIAFSINGCESEKSDPVWLKPRNMVAIDDSIHINAASTAQIEILNNDKKGCYEFVRQSISIISKPIMGDATLTKDGFVKYVPFRHSSGIDQFIYQVEDEIGDVSNPAIVKVYISNSCGLVYPNPVVNLLTVNITTELAKYIRICEVDGKVLELMEVNAGVYQLEMGKYADAMYLLSVMTAEGKVICTYKVIKGSG